MMVNILEVQKMSITNLNPLPPVTATPIMPPCKPPRKLDLSIDTYLKIFDRLDELKKEIEVFNERLINIEGALKQLSP
jgi:hypothetical protein